MAKRLTAGLWGYFAKDPVRGLGLLFALLLALAYLAANWRACGGELFGILDDVYIHFQYAKRIALGHFFTYTPGGSPSSGGTSFLYPFLLAPAWLLGLREWTLMLFAAALGLFGMLIAYHHYYQALRENLSRAAAVFLFMLMLPAGATYATMLGGMEGVLLMVGLAVAIRYGLRWQALGMQRDFAILTLAVTLTPLARPEGMVIVGFYYLLVLRYAFGLHARPRWALVPLPILAYGAFLLLCHLVYGSTTLNSVLVKSWFTDPNWDFRAALNETYRTWKTFLQSVPGGGDSMPHMVKRLWWLSAFGGVILLVRDLYRREVGLGVILVCLALGTLPPSATYSFYWGAYRYYVPFFALFYIGAAGGLWALWRFPFAPLRFLFKPVVLAAACYFAYQAYASNDFFIRYYAASAHNIQTQQAAAGRYLREKTDEAAIVGMNDAGAIAYFSERRTYDFVGLTTQGAGRPYREGKGGVYEALEHLPPWQRPNVWALYPHWLGMNELFAEELATFTSPTKDGVGSRTHNVLRAEPQVYAYSDRPYLALVPKDFTLAAELDHGDLLSERAAVYQVTKPSQPKPFYAASAFERLVVGDGGPAVSEGGRLIPPGATERFSLTLEGGRESVLVVRVDGRQARHLQMTLNGAELPPLLAEVGDGWREVALSLPTNALQSGPNDFSVKSLRGAYAAYHLWIYQSPR